jgi:hypothetical protein
LSLLVAAVVVNVEVAVAVVVGILRVLVILSVQIL